MIYEFYAMMEMFEDVLKEIWEFVIVKRLQSPEPPDRNELERVLECMKKCWNSAMADVGLLEQAWLGKTLTEIKAEAFDCMMNCTS